MQLGDLHCVFNGKSRLLKLFVNGGSGSNVPLAVYQCHDVGVNDDRISGDEDQYGHYCKVPPGILYVLGEPDTINPPERAYGFFFTPINDNAVGTLAEHGRQDLGIHGGGSDLGDPFAAEQGWEWTYGCLRLQNEDNAAFVAHVRTIQNQGNTAWLDVVWP